MVYKNTEIKELDGASRSMLRRYRANKSAIVKSIMVKKKQEVIDRLIQPE